MISLSALAAMAQADTTLKEFTGRYVFPDGNVVPDVTVALDGNSLSMSSSAGTSSLEKLGVDSFSIVEFSGTAVFKRNGSNKVTGVHIEAAGYVMDGTKEENQLAIRNALASCDLHAGTCQHEKYHEEYALLTAVAYLRRL
jgi:hypothetical protein